MHVGDARIGAGSASQYGPRQLTGRALDVAPGKKRGGYSWAGMPPSGACDSPPRDRLMQASTDPELRLFAFDDIYLPLGQVAGLSRVKVRNGKRKTCLPFSESSR